MLSANRILEGVVIIGVGVSCEFFCGGEFRESIVQAGRIHSLVLPFEKNWFLRYAQKPRETRGKESLCAGMEICGGLEGDVVPV